MNRGTGKKAYTVKIHPSEYKDVTSFASRKRTNRRPTLTVMDRINIAHRVFIQGYMHEDVAKEFRITRQCVTNIIRKASKNPKFLAEMVSDQQHKD